MCGCYVIKYTRSRVIRQVRYTNDMQMQAKQYLLAISGGVDSMVLLDILARRKGIDITVAHVDHGIRSESARDAELVRSAAAQYGMPFVGTALKLGVHASEESARTARYAFLRQVARARSATIVTAHHADDVIESIAINLLRGTGWRGLAVMNAPDISRPLIHKYKSEILAYAVRNRLVWHEDETNQSDRYLRNRVRQQLRTLPQAVKQQLHDLWQQQCELADDIDDEIARLAVYQRYFYTMLSPVLATEILRGLLRSHGVAQTRPQAAAILLAIKTAQPGSRYSLTKGVFLQFSADDFSIQRQ